METVATALEEVVQAVILPRFRALAEGDVSEKTPGELVTVADREAEVAIGIRLHNVLAVPVVGEEAASERPELLRALNEAPAVWLVDPLDGTSNFVAGRSQFAVMVALVKDGRTCAAWIAHPTTGHMYTAEVGSGAYRNGSRIRRFAAPSDPARLRGAVSPRFLNDAERAKIAEVTPRFGKVESASGCAGVDYCRLMDAELDFVYFSRALPWDHAPGALLLTEAGGTARFSDATPYDPTARKTGLLDGADSATWQTASAVLRL